MYRKISTFVLAVVIIAGALFSAVNTFSLFASLFGTGISGIMWSLAGLALFDVGALGWLLHFAHTAKGNAQRATAAVCGVLCVLLTLTAAGTEILLTQTLITVPTWAGTLAIGAILLALAINIVGAVVNHMTAPEVLRAIREEGVESDEAEADAQLLADMRRAERQAMRARIRADMPTVTALVGTQRAGNLLAGYQGAQAQLPSVINAAPLHGANGTHKLAEAEAGPK